MNYTDEHLKRILSDVEYLIDEAEALTYVIDAVPVGEKAAGVESMMEMLQLIDHAQLSYYRPLIERLYSVPRVDEQPRDFRNSFEDIKKQSGPAPENEKKEVKALLKTIAANRRNLLEFVNKLPVEDLRQYGQINGRQQSIADLLEEMVVFERKQLKNIAERILSLDNTMKPGRNQS